MNPLRWLSGLLVVLALLAGAALWLQRQATEALRSELALLRDENRALTRLRAENQKLVAARMPAAEVERLRADHAAVARLQREIEALRKSVRAQERALAGK